MSQLPRRASAPASAPPMCNLISCMISLGYDISHDIICANARDIIDPSWWNHWSMISCWSIMPWPFHLWCHSLMISWTHDVNGNFKWNQAWYLFYHAPTIYNTIMSWHLLHDITGDFTWNQLGYSLWYHTTAIFDIMLIWSSVDIIVQNTWNLAMTSMLSCMISYSMILSCHDIVREGYHRTYHTLIWGMTSCMESSVNALDPQHPLAGVCCGFQFSPGRGGIAWGGGLWWRWWWRMQLLHPLASAGTSKPYAPSWSGTGLLQK